MDYIYSDDNDNVETFSKNITFEDSIIENCSFNIKKNDNKFEFSEEYDDKTTDNISMIIYNLTEKILDKFLKNNTYKYSIENNFFFCESW